MGAVVESVVQPVVKAVESVGQAVSSAAQEVGKAVEQVGQAVATTAKTVGKAIEKNPATAIAVITAAVVAPEILPAITSAVGGGAIAGGAATGALLGAGVGAASTIDTSKNVLNSMALGAVGGGLGGAVAPGVTNALTGTVGQTAAQIAGSTAAGASVGGATQAIKGGNIGTGLLTGAVSGAVGSGASQAAGGGTVGNIIGQLAGGTAGGLAAGQTGEQALTTGAYSAVNAAMAGAVSNAYRQGVEPNAQQVAKAGNTDVATAQNFIDTNNQAIAQGTPPNEALLASTNGQIDFSKGVQLAQLNVTIYGTTTDVPVSAPIGGPTPSDVEYATSRAQDYTQQAGQATDAETKQMLENSASYWSAEANRLQREIGYSAPVFSDVFTPDMNAQVFDLVRGTGGKGRESTGSVSTEGGTATRGVAGRGQGVSDALGMGQYGTGTSRFGELGPTSTDRTSTTGKVPSYTSGETTPLPEDTVTQKDTTTKETADQRVYAGGRAFSPYTTGTAGGAIPTGSMGLFYPGAGSQALAQALQVVPTLATGGGGGDVDPSRTGGKKKNVWNVASLKLKDALGA